MRDIEIIFVDADELALTSPGQWSGHGGYEHEELFSIETRGIDS